MVQWHTENGTEIYNPSTKMIHSENKQAGCSDVSRWPLNDDFLGISDKIYHLLAVFDRCMLNGSWGGDWGGGGRIWTWPFKQGSHLIEVDRRLG